MTNLVFDYDGTLNDSIIIYAPAFRKAHEYLMNKRLIPKREYSDDEISGWLGFTAKDMWCNFAPHLDDEEKANCSRIIADEMLRLTLEGKASLYPHTEKALFALKEKGFQLLLLSNCTTSYMEANRKVFALDRFFSAFYSAEAFDYIPKSEIFEHIRKCWNGSFLIVGDRYHDMEIAQRYKLPSIGCLYGYGAREELHCASCKIDSIEEITEAIEKLFPVDK